MDEQLVICRSEKAISLETIHQITSRFQWAGFIAVAPQRLSSTCHAKGPNYSLGESGGIYNGFLGPNSSGLAGEIRVGGQRISRQDIEEFFASLSAAGPVLLALADYDGHQFIDARSLDEPRQLPTLSPQAAAREWPQLLTQDRRAVRIAM